MSDHNDDLRELIQDSVADIRPQGSLDDILDRAKKVDPMTRRWFLPVVAAAAVIGLAVGGAVWLSNDSNSPKHDDGPAGTPTPTAGTDMTTRSVPVYFLGDTAHGTKLYREFQRQQVCQGGAECLTLASARTAVAGSPEDPDYRNPWPADTTVMTASYDGSVITLDLHIPWPEATGNGPHPTAEEKLAVQQLVYSAQAGHGQGKVPVQLLADGAKVPSILGVSTQLPILAADPGDILAPVQISSPGSGAELPAGDVDVSGVASTFEANVIWELRSGGDAGTEHVVQSGHATAAECCTMSPYSFTIKDVQPGSYTLIVHDEDVSGEGRTVNEDTKEIVVR